MWSVDGEKDVAHIRETTVDNPFNWQALLEGNAEQVTKGFLFFRYQFVSCFIYLGHYSYFFMCKMQQSNLPLKLRALQKERVGEMSTRWYITCFMWYDVLFLSSYASRTRRFSF
jgi:hypothetical protein